MCEEDFDAANIDEYYYVTEDKEECCEIDQGKVEIPVISNQRIAARFRFFDSQIALLTSSI